MPLTPDRMDKLQSRIQEKDIATTCPACASANWVASEIIALPLRTRTKPTKEGLQMPLSS